MSDNAASQSTVQSLMSSDLIAVGPKDRVGRARDLILSLGIHALPVMEDNAVVGIVTSSDLVDDWPEDAAVSTIMTRSVLSVDVEASLREAAGAMLEAKTHHLLVEASGETIGILSSLDLLQALLI